MDLKEKLQRGVLKALQDASPKQGIKLSEAIKQAGFLPDRKTKDQVRKFLEAYAKQYPKQLYYMIDGEVKFPGEEQETPERGKFVCWKLKGAPRLLRKDTQALALALSQKFSRFLLPPTERKFINSLYEKQLKDQALKSWLNQVEVVPRYPPLFPNYNEDTYAFTEQVILNALKQKKGFHGRYLGNRSIYYPVKLIRREWVSYVLCTENTENPIYKEYAIHRFDIDLADDPDDVALIPLPEFHSINDKITNTEYAVSGNWCILKKIVFEVTGEPAQHISEMRFHESINKTKLTTILSKIPTDGSRLTRVTIEVKELPYTYELKTWLLGLGKNVKVIEAIPQDEYNVVDVKADLLKEIEQMKKMYK